MLGVERGHGASDNGTSFIVIGLDACIGRGERRVAVAAEANPMSPPATPFQHVAAEIDRDAREIGAEVRVAAKVRQRAQAAHEGFLAHIVGIVSRSEHGRHRPRDRRLVARDDLANGGFFSRGGAGREITLGRVARHAEHLTVDARDSFHRSFHGMDGEVGRSNAANVATRGFYRNGGTMRNGRMWLVVCVGIALACAGAKGLTAADTAAAGATTGGTAAGDIPDFYKAFTNTVTNGVSVSVDGNYVVIRTTDVPDHKSPYFPPGSAQYEAYDGTNARFQLNPNAIEEQHFVFRIPITPTPLATPSPTPLGPIGVAVNGVALFNQYAGNDQPLSSEINSFDQYNGHPQMMGVYHYHVEPTWITRSSREALIGVLLDGYPVYGPMENGQLVDPSSLDAAHGHFGPTKEFPQGIYHYHTTAEAPYINGSGFHGAPGTVSQ